MDSSQTDLLASAPFSGEPAQPQEKPELVIGLVGPLGTPLQDVYRLLKQELRTFGYNAIRIRLSSILDSVSGLDAYLDDSNEYKRIESRMDAGSELRKITEKGDMLSRLAISRIWDERKKIHNLKNKNDQGMPQAEGTSPEDISEQMVPAAGVAYVLDSLKNPDEVHLLREIYGDGFLLISAYAPWDERKTALAMRLGGSQVDSSANTLAAGLIERDHSEEEAGEFGQRVSDVFALADLVVDTREHKGCESSLRRFLQIFFNYPFHSPSPDEFGMFLAKCSALRSLDMSRQVGAAILDSARKGISIVGATLYCTTFPCHLCVRMIIGSGIQRVVYMEPYHKSKTEVMYRDSVVVDPPSDVPGKVNFTPFVGIAPEKFEKLFRWSGKRRDRDGTPSQWEPEIYGTRIKRYINSYIYLEAMTVESLESILKSRGLTWTPEKEEVEDG